jgi:hypothetical protein
LTRAVERPEVRRRLLQLGFEGRSSTPEEQAAYTGAELSRWSRVIRSKGLKFD